MRAKIYIPILFMLSLMLMGCPYESEVPIDQPLVKVDKNLLGKWVDQENNNGHPGYLEITEANEMKYQIDHYSWEKDHYNKERLFSYISVVGDQNFMNAQSVGDAKYSLYKYLLEGKSLKVLEVTDNIDEKFNKSEDLKAFIKQHMNLSFFYNNDETIFLKEEK